MGATDNLKYQLGRRPATMKRDISATPMKDVAARMRQWWTAGSASMAKPEAEGIRFYMVNHALGEAIRAVPPEAPLGPWMEVVETYHEVAAPVAVRAFYYLLTICARENRHCQNPAQIRSALTAINGPVATDWVAGLKGQGSGGVASKVRSEPPACTLGQLAGALRDSFYKGNWSGGYGGKKWGVVADCLVEFVFGRYSADMMLDVVWTLCHNNGPIFNKGMLYHGYTSELVRLLDVQRSGQVPQYVASGASGYVTPELKQLHARLAAVVGPSFDGYVDWYKVEALGAVGHYEAEKQAQVAAHGMPTGDYVAAAKKAKVKAKAKAAEQTGVQIMPGVFVQKANFKRKKAA